MQTSKRHYAIAVIGDWHLAFCTAACIASTGQKTLFVNPLLGEAQRWSGFPELKLAEPGLPEMIQNAKNLGNLDYANGFEEDWSADVVWLAIDTPVNDRDEPDTTPLLDVAKKLKAKGVQFEIFAINSQIPLGFSTLLEKSFGFKVAYVPENLRLGKGIETFLRADRTVIGASSPDTAEQLKTKLAKFQTEFLLCDLPTAEMVKHGTNVFLAMSISFSNELARIGELMGVDNQLVGKALKLDSRIGKQAYVMPGLGFAGGTLPRDLRIVQKLGREHTVPTPLVDAVLTVNESTAQALTQSVREYWGGLSGKKILVIGYAYKAEIDTLRRSLSVDIARELNQAGAVVIGYDPAMNHRDLSSLKPVLRHVADWREIEAPDAVLVMTPRPMFRELDWKALGAKVSQSERKPLVLDAVNVIEGGQILAAGLVYKRLWQPIQTT
ncbi:nucleotide sugar dehydrogenase [Bdellovibrionota bacterium FG-1]